MVTEGNAPQSAQASEFGVLEHRFGDHATINQPAVFNPNPTRNSQIIGLDLQSYAFKKAAASTNAFFSVGLMGSEAVQSQKAPQNCGESNMVESSSGIADTSNDDVDLDGKKQKLMGQSAAVDVADSSDKSKEKPPHKKTLHRLAQNREAAKKSRLKKKAYVLQLEDSRLKLSHLEQELQRARQQGISISNIGDQSHAHGTANGTLAFDLEYSRWLEDQNRRINELKTAVKSHVGDTELCTIVENVTTHYNYIYRLKANADVFHILSGMWKTPAERCFMWIGGFRPSEIIKLFVDRLELLTEQQLSGIFNLRRSSHQAEDAISQGMDALKQSLAETLVANGSLGPEGSSGNVANYMGLMAMSMGKLGMFKSFLKQADYLRQQTLQQMHLILTPRQSAHALLLINDYFSRLRALSSLWLARPRE